MEWLELHIDTVHEGLEAVEAFLSAQGIDSVVIDDEQDFQDFLEDTHAFWDDVDQDLQKAMAGKSRVTFYLPANDDGFAQLGQVRIALEDFRASHPDCGTLLLSMEQMKDADWENNWKQYYKPMEIGKRLLVIPEWETADPGDRVPLILEPGLTFGTGSHATTRLVLTALEQAIHGGEKVADLGCGSGILSIAALKLGASHAVAVDIDEKCPEVAYANAAMNGIGKDAYEVLVGDVAADEALRQRLGGGYDVVLANIVSDVIIALAPHVKNLLSEKGLFICSGIIDDRAEEVAGKLREAGLVILQTKSADGWFAYVCKL